jgi:hypothetical protein
MADKGKSKDIIICNPRMSNISQKEIALKAPDDKAKKFGGTERQAQLMSQARQHDQSITESLTPTYGRSGAKTYGLANSAGQSAYGQRRQPPHKALKGKQTQWRSTYSWLIKANPTFDQLLFKNTSKKTVLRDWSTKKPRSPAKTKRVKNGLKGDTTSIAYSSYETRVLSTRLLIVGILSCSNMEWYDDESMTHV